ncbi:adenosylmethionine decarboxylase [Thalassotalea eurytherma]|uniref:S-adenosylmethionine decarboxylase SpeD n=1 Tax=Thalassotalea eurytherma TaxID=1144278 RepID=A0ABQ6H3W1_9GAMM|nr:adenosylmethionine decarboxylase [Thalassotalea eurytherma]GLX81126.1 S-adenosylmethionine decarboxylase SpeD [Thalassotalea eurytherma]
MYFEGSEKKAEIVIDSQQLSLLDDFADEFWASLVECCNAQILSHISNEQCKAFLLSESSLFVWNDRLLILTCGVTQLINSVEYFIQQVGVDKIQQVIYQRKNEYFAHEQASCFGDDIKSLGQYVKGKAMRFGELDSHHNYVFHQDNDYLASAEDKTYELLAYQINSEASKVLTTAHLSAQKIRQFLTIDSMLSGFLIDDYVFEPFGYSLNAIKGDQYLTIHVTPQEDSSYVSFESNLNLVELAPQILAVLQPASFDLITFNEFEITDLLTKHVPELYVSQSLVSDQLSNGYQVGFANFIKPQRTFGNAKSLDIRGENHAL